MSFKNNLIRLAKEGQPVIRVKDGDVNKVVEHIRTTRAIPSAIPDAAIKSQLYAGRVKILGSKIEVIGRAADGPVYAVDPMALWW